MIWVRRAHLVVAWAFVAGVFIQYFLAGLGVFKSSENFQTHAGFGFLLGLLTLVILVLAAVGGLGRRQVQYAAGLFGLFFVQSMLVSLRSSNPTIAALHPVNGLLILLVSVAMAREAWRARNAEPSSSAATAQPAESTVGS